VVSVVHDVSYTVDCVMNIVGFAVWYAWCMVHVSYGMWYVTGGVRCMWYDAVCLVCMVLLCVSLLVMCGVGSML